MPTQRAHGGAALVPINLVAPGFAGLRTEGEGSVLGQEWATTLNNAIFDASGRTAVRKGWLSQTGTPVAGVVMRAFEFIKADKTSEMIFSTDADIFSGVDAPSSVEGTLGITEGNIKFVNFADECIALGTGTSSNPSAYTGTGDFTTITVNSGTAPTSGVGTSAYGRLWVVDADGSTIRYSALIDKTRWDVADGGGTVDMSKVWPAGQDTVVAIEELAGDLVIFGRNNIVIWTDGAGSDLGINPLNMYVSDSVGNVGAVSQFAIVRALGDLWFLSSSGVQNLNRAFQDKTTPTSNLSRNVQGRVLGYLDNETDDDDITMTYSPREDLVLLIFPSSNKVVAFNTKQQMEDGTYRVSEWSTTLQTAAYRTNDRSLLGSLTGTVGELMLYSGFSDDGASYDFSYESGWLDLGEAAQYIKFVKRLTSFVFVQADTTINFTLFYDFNTVPTSVPAAAAGSVGAEYSVAEWNEDEYSGGITIRSLSIPGQGSGQYIKVGANLDTASAQFALQQINLYARVGRIA